MSDAEDCNSLGEASNASAFSCQSDISLDEPAFHLLLCESPGRNRGDTPSLRNALRILHKNDTKYKFIEIDLDGGPSCVQENALYSKGAFGSVGKALAKNTSVESIVISSYDGNEEYVGHFLSLFERMKGNRTLRRFELSGFTGEMEQALSKCAELFSEEGSKLDSFQVEHSDISLPLIRRIMIGLTSGGSPLEHLSMSHIEFEDSCVREIFSFFEEKPEKFPRKLSLEHGIENFDDVCSILARLLMCQACSLEELTIPLLMPTEDEVIDIVTSLERNTTLKHLNIDLTNLTMNGKDPILLLLCDTKNITATYNSNHTLGVLGRGIRDSKISSYLKLNNKYSDKQLVAAAKIIDAHFAHNFHLDNFDMMKSQLLTLLVSFVNRGFLFWNKALKVENKRGQKKEVTNNNLTINFLMVRNIPAFLKYVKPRWKRQKTCSGV